MRKEIKGFFFVSFLLLSFGLRAQKQIVPPVVFPSKLVVSKDGTGNYKTIQEAINSVRDLGQKTVRIFIKNGIYHEKIIVPTYKTNISLIGESEDSTIITNNDFSGKLIPSGNDGMGKNKFNTFNSYTVLVEGNDFSASNLTIENTAGAVGQALALHVSADRVTIKHCKILGNQDTLYLATEQSRQYYQDCYIEGTTDFIFGEATAVFESCTIKSKTNSFITAAATKQSQVFGFVFFNCKLVANTEVNKVYLGRPWRPYAKTVFIHCELGSHIDPEGWNPWKGDAMFPDKEKTTFYAEYLNIGEGANTDKRISWSNQLTDKAAEKYTTAQILGGKDKWNPEKNIVQIDPRPFADNAGHWYAIFDKTNIINALPGRPKHKPTEIIAIANNILLFQKNNGGWPKNYDVFANLSAIQEDSVRNAKKNLNTTFDNGSTYTQIAALAIAYNETNFEKYKLAAIKGLDFILAAQYSNGGWPQYYPLETNYSRCITYNDGAFEGIVSLLKAIKEASPIYDFLDANYRNKITDAYEKAIDCIIKTQINDKGIPTAWCQQYNEVSLEPAWARKFEPPSICNKESADLVLFLMDIQHPSKEIIAAIKNAVQWFEDSKIYNTRINTISAPRLETPFRISETDKVMVIDSLAPPIWTRYYELKTHKPIFCNRDSKIVYSLAEVLRERRDGYAWYTYAPQQVINAYPTWLKTNGSN